MKLNPHEHAMFAIVGMYGGQEDNAFFRRAEGGLEPAGGKDVLAGDVLVLGDDVTGSVSIRATMAPDRSSIRPLSAAAFRVGVCRSVMWWMIRQVVAGRSGHFNAILAISARSASVSGCGPE